MKEFANQGSITVDLQNNEVIIRKRSSRSIRTPFSAISAITNRKRKAMSPDVFDLLDKVSKGSFSVFNNLKFNRSEEDNLTTYVGEEMNKTDRESLSRRLKELKDVGLIRRVKKELKGSKGKVYTFKDPRNTFIINPDMIRCNDHNESEYLWRQCESSTQHTDNC